MASLEVTVYVDQHQYEHNGYDPADVASAYFADAFEYAGINSWSVITETSVPIDGRDVPASYTSDEHTYDIFEYFADWLKDENSYVNNPDGDISGDRDCYHLCMDPADLEGPGGLGGGFASIGPGSGLANLSSFNPPRYVQKTNNPAGGAVQIALQEAGHALGLCPFSDHECGLHYAPSHSYAGSVPDTGSDTVYTTPMGCGRNNFNAECGIYGTDPDTASTEYADGRYFDECAGSKLRGMFN